MNVLLSCPVLIETTRIIWLKVNIAIWLYYCWWHRNIPANIMQLLSTQWSCSQVNIQLSYVGVPYRLTSRVICRTICCKHMWAKNWQQNDTRYIAFDPPSVIDYNAIPLCVEYPMAGNLTQAAVRSVTTALKSRLRSHWSFDSRRLMSRQYTIVC